MKFKTLCAIAALLAAPFAQAAFVTIDQAGMNAVFSQASFGTTPIAIRIGPVTQIVAPTLLDITTDAEITQIFNLHVGALNVVNFYFVDTIDSCSGFNVNIVGCGETPGNDFVVESSFAALTGDDPDGAGFPGISTAVNLLAHELGHNLGLGHRNDGSNLMHFQLSNNGGLNAAEVATIFSNPGNALVQSDANGFFIQINPVLIVARDVQDVPEPSTAALALAGLLFAGLRSRKLRQARA